VGAGFGIELVIGDEVAEGMDVDVDMVEAPLLVIILLSRDTIEAELAAEFCP
jgi:hypothetical protein